MTCLQLCPGASACYNYTVSRPGLMLLNKHWRLVELAVFLEFRLSFCPIAHSSGADGWDQQLIRETAKILSENKVLDTKEPKRKMSPVPRAVLNINSYSYLILQCLNSKQKGVLHSIMCGSKDKLISKHGGLLEPHKYFP